MGAGMVAFLNTGGNVTIIGILRFILSARPTFY